MSCKLISYLCTRLNVETLVDPQTGYLHRFAVGLRERVDGVIEKPQLDLVAVLCSICRTVSDLILCTCK